MKSIKPPKAAGRSDIFQTHEKDIAPLIPYLNGVPFVGRGVAGNGHKPKIWECAAGQGNIVRYLRAQGFDVDGTDIESGFDFLDALCPIPDCDVIVTNPPYSVKDEWLARCYDIGKPFALLLPITALGEQKRVKMFKKEGIQILLPKARPTFTTPSGKEGGSWFYTAWFCWRLLPETICYE